MFICPHCTKEYSKAISRRTHWNKDMDCNKKHMLWRLEVQQSKLICQYCSFIFKEIRYQVNHSKGCFYKQFSDSDEFSYKSLKESDLGETNYERLLKNKKSVYGSEFELMVPLSIYESRFGYVNQQLQAYFKDALNKGNPVQFRSDVRNDQHKLLIETLNRLSGVVVFDGAWKTRYHQGYQGLPNRVIEDIPINLIQDRGLIFYWVLPGTYKVGLRVFSKFGYTFLKVLRWVKLTKKGNLINSVRPQFSMEMCLVGYKGITDAQLLNDVPNTIMSIVRGNSEKPEELWHWIQSRLPNEIIVEGFARKNANRKMTIHVGNEVPIVESLLISQEKSKKQIIYEHFENDEQFM